MGHIEKQCFSKKRAEKVKKREKEKEAAKDNNDGGSSSTNAAEGAAAPATNIRDEIMAAVREMAPGMMVEILAELQQGPTPIAKELRRRPLSLRMK